MEKVSQRKITRLVSSKKDENYHDIKSVMFIDNIMILNVDNKKYNIPLEKVSKKLLHANKKEKEAFRIICSGYGINWPLIDEDLSVDGLIKISKK